MTIYNLLGGFLNDNILKDSWDPTITHDHEIYDEAKKEIKVPTIKIDKALAMEFYNECNANDDINHDIINILITDLRIQESTEHFILETSFSRYLRKTILLNLNHNNSKFYF